MKDDGASPEEIRAAVKAMLEGSGITPPESSDEASTSPSEILGNEEGKSASWGEIKAEFD